MASVTKKFKPRLAKPTLKTNGCLANHGLTSLVTEATRDIDIVNVTLCDIMFLRTVL